MIRVELVRSRSDRRDFIELPYRLYRRDPLWVPPLRSDVKEILDPRRHPFHRHGEIAPFLAREPGGRVVGRIAAVRNDLHVEVHREPVGFFGFFECERDPEAAHALFDSAGAWLRGRGLEVMRGPASPSLNEEAGLLVEGFDKPPAIMMPYNPPWYAELIEDYGFRKAKDLLAYYRGHAEQPERLVRMSEALAKRHKIVVRGMDKSRYWEEVAQVRALYNSAWEMNWGFVPMTEAELNHMAKKLKPVLDPDLIAFAEVDGKPAGFALGLVDLNRALRHAGGRLWPLGWLQILRHSRGIDTFRVLTLGVLAPYRKTGAAEMMYLYLFRTGPPKGITKGEFSWILEDNLSMRAGLEKLDAHVYKVYRLYDVALARVGAASGTETGKEGGVPPSPFAVPKGEKSELSPRAAGSRDIPGGVALVTGATGFVGSHLADALLEEGWRVRCLVRPSSSLRWLPREGEHETALPETGSRGRLELARGGLSDPSALKEALSDVHVVFHVAGITSAASPSSYARANLEGTRNLVEALRRRAPGALLVFCSSLAAAGPSRDGMPLTERDPPDPIGPYGASKLAAERIVTDSGLDHVILRPPAVYGPRDRDLFAVFRLAASGVAFRLGPPDQRLSLVHAHDLAHGFLDAAELGAGRGVFYMTDGEVHTWDQVIEAIGNALGRRPRVIHVPAAAAAALGRASRLLARVRGTKPWLTPERAQDLAQPAWICDDAKARRELGYESVFDLKQGFADTVAWYRANGWLAA